MKRPETQIRSLLRLIDEGIRVELVAEPLFSLPATTPAEEAASLLEEKGFDYCGVDQSDASPYLVERSQLALGSVADFATEIQEDRIVDADASLWSVLRQIVTQEVLFVRTDGKVDSIVTVADLDKQPSRLMLFGIVSMMEMVMHATVTHACTSTEWPLYLSEDRKNMYEELHRKRLEKNQELDLLSCTQLCDKMTIISKHRDLYSLFAESKSKLKDLVNRIGTIRDNLAHSHPPAQGIEWNKLVEVVEQAHRIIASYPMTYSVIQEKYRRTEE
tara:strand:- start:20559 stop:21380 length:822 start_codon:yes stop_codon:yes gene_type:complete